MLKPNGKREFSNYDVGSIELARAFKTISIAFRNETMIVRVIVTRSYSMSISGLHYPNNWKNPKAKSESMASILINY